jgi:predicted nucleotidyltransferase
LLRPIKQEKIESRRLLNCLLEEKNYQEVKKEKTTANNGYSACPAGHAPYPNRWHLLNQIPSNNKFNYLWNMIEFDKSKMQELCKAHNVKSLYLFGSATGNSFSSESDIDFLVRFKEFEISKYFMNYISFKESLKKLFEREIDLVEEQTLKNPILINSINRNKELIYG